MGRKRSPGLKLRNGIWHIDKRINGRHIQRSAGTSWLCEAEAILAKVIEEQRQAEIFGVRPDRTFEEAAAKFVIENKHKASLRGDITQLKRLLPFIGGVTLRQLHMGSLDHWMQTRRRDGVSNGTINHGLQIVRRIVNLASSEWVDENGLTWLDRPPKIKLLANRGKRKPYPMNWEEQDRLFAELPEHLRVMALFKVNTGLRDSDVCCLRWDDEVVLSDLNTSVFIIPCEDVKDTDGGREDDRLVVLNGIAKQVIEGQRGQHSTHVFHYLGAAITRMGNTAWYKATARAGLQHVRVHDLKHTYGRRLRSAGVSFEDRQDLLGHRSKRMTTHYSTAEIANLIAMSERVVRREGESATLTMLRSRRQNCSHNVRTKRPMHAKCMHPHSDQIEDAVQVIENIGSGGGT